MESMATPSHYPPLICVLPAQIWSRGGGQLGDHKGSEPTAWPACPSSACEPPVGFSWALPPCCVWASLLLLCFCGGKIPWKLSGRPEAWTPVRSHSGPGMETVEPAGICLLSQGEHRTQDLRVCVESQAPLLFVGILIPGGHPWPWLSVRPPLYPNLDPSPAVTLQDLRGARAPN